MRASYPTYKSTSIPWMPEMPEHWEQRKNKYLFRRSKSLVGKDFEKYPVLSLTMNGVIRRDLDNPMGKMPATFADYQLIQDNTLLFCLFDYDVTPRTVGMVNEKGIVSPAYTSMYPVEKINLRYYYYWFLMLDERKMLLTHVTNLRNSVSYETFAGLFSPFPPLTEQTAIANYLDAKSEQINRFIEKKQKLIALLKEQKQAMINKAVTKGILSNVPMKDSGVEWLGEIPSHWKVIKLKYIANAIIGVTYSPNDIVDENGGILVLRSSNIQNGKISYSDNVYIKKDIPQKLLTKKGDILLCARNGSADLIGKNICIDEHSEGMTFGAFMTIVRSKYWRYLSWFFNSSIFKSQTGLFATSTINQLTSDTLNNLKIAFPIDAKERDEIIENLEIETQQIDLGIEKIEKEIEKVRELKQSLIAEVVTGKIKVV